MGVEAPSLVEVSPPSFVTVILRGCLRTSSQVRRSSWLRRPTDTLRWFRTLGRAYLAFRYPCFQTHPLNIASPTRAWILIHQHDRLLVSRHLFHSTIQSRSGCIRFLVYLVTGEADATTNETIYPDDPVACHC